MYFFSISISILSYTLQRHYLKKVRENSEAFNECGQTSKYYRLHVHVTLDLFWLNKAIIPYRHLTVHLKFDNCFQIRLFCIKQLVHMGILDVIAPKHVT